MDRARAGQLICYIFLWYTYPHLTGHALVVECDDSVGMFTRRGKAAADHVKRYEVPKFDRAI